jgi:glycerol-1-phosphate dehydrogenase [NAD(P)+]
VLDVADGLPRRISCAKSWRKPAFTSYRDLGISQGQFRNIMKTCAYIRNRFTVLRLMCDYELFDFATMDD